MAGSGDGAAFAQGLAATWQWVDRLRRSGRPAGPYERVMATPWSCRGSS
ncbi:hypothetical protein [Streptomyces sp. NPDC090021]